MAGASAEGITEANEQRTPLMLRKEDEQEDDDRLFRHRGHGTQ